MNPIRLIELMVVNRKPTVNFVLAAISLILAALKFQK